ncbi:MAG: MBL fold metallo-hydrolase [Spirochaetaceae bacterium]|jgi:glyoxylase-like metal-dependent hydrolase (beta-lactamase superfamily II)|nr:MBL fold metallo-hydrolase [Spirochaetaceae bacterium]
MNKSTKPSPTVLVVGALATNCWLYPLTEASSPSASSYAQTQPCVVIDPGADSAMIIARMAQLHLYPRYIVLTHGHFDHVAAIPGIVASVFPGAEAPEIAIHREDAAYLGPEAYSVHQAAFRAVAGSAAYVDALWEPLPPATRLLAEGDRIGSFQVLHLPGHSPGSIALYEKEQQLLFSGDTLFRHGVGRTDLPGGDWATLRHSLNRLFTLDGSCTVYPGHGSRTTIAAEQQP